MRNLIASFVLLAVLTPAAALAGDPPGPPAGAAVPSDAQMQRMQQFGSEMVKIRAESRAQILTALTPAHKAQFAQEVGEMAIAVTPDPLAVAHRLDAMLTPQERQAIVAAHEAAQAKVRAMMSQDGRALSPPATVPDAGRILLMMSIPMPMMPPHPAMPMAPHPM